jgi:hypothetical protein
METADPTAPEEATRFVGALFEARDPILVRLIETWTEQQRKHSRVICSHYRLPGALLEPEVWAKLQHEAETERANLFYGVCPRFRANDQFDHAFQIRTVRALYSDIDNCAVDEVKERCRATSLPSASITVKSGHGVHLYWLLDEPYLIDDAGEPPPVLKDFNGDRAKVCKYFVDPKTQDRVNQADFNHYLSPKACRLQEVLHGIGIKIGGDRTHDLSRILRLPGTLNRKEERNGKQPVACVLVECDPTRRYHLAEFEAFAQFSSEGRRAREIDKIRLPSRQKSTAARRNRLTALLNRCAVAPVGTRSERDFALCCWAVEHGWDKEEVWAEAQSVGKFAQRGRDYFDTTWKNAEDATREKLYIRASRPPKIEGPAGMPNGKPGLDGAGRVLQSGNGSGDQDFSDSPDGMQGGGGLPEEGAQADGQLPSIVGNNRQLRHVTRDALWALEASRDRLRLCQRGGLLSRMKIERATNKPFLEPLTDAALRGILARSANWLKEGRARGEIEYLDDAPPMDVVKDIASLPSWDVPVLREIIEAPVFSDQGLLVAEPGYHPQSMLFYHASPSLHLSTVPDRPTPDEVRRAKQLLLDDLYGDFPFADESSRAHALIALIQPFVRPMIDGPTPLYLIDAPTEGMGKGLLAACIAIPATGRPAEAMTEASESEEWRKRLTAALAEAPTFILLDNLSRKLTSSALATALTEGVVKDRLLGVSKMATLPVTCTWLATGNNIRVSREMARRTVWIRLDAKTDTPWKRTGFKYPDLQAWAIAHRGELVWAALTLIQAWQAAGRPHGTGLLGRFEAWARTMGGILDVVGVPGLLANTMRWSGVANEDAAAWRTFVARWWERFGDKKVGVADLFELATAQGLLADALGDGSERSQRTRLGRALGHLRDRVFGVLRIELAGETHNDVGVYRLRRVKPRTNEQS